MSETMWASFEQLVRANRLSHAYAFSGDDVLAKEKLIEQIVVALYSQLTASDNTELFASRLTQGQVSDVLHVVPEGQSIKIDQIRQLKEWCMTSPVELPFKFVVIENTELMTVSASNALLTLLEEPEDNVYFILNVSDSLLLLPTIRSRVQVYYFTSASDSFDMNDSPSISQKHRDILQTLPMATRVRMLENYDEAEFDRWVDEMQLFYNQLYSRQYEGFITVATRLKSYHSIQQVMDILDYLARLNYNKMQTLLGHDVQVVCEMNDAIIEAKQYLLANGSPQATLEQLVLSMILQ